MPGIGNSRAEANRVTDANAGDLVKIQQQQTAYPNGSQWFEREITVGDLLSTASDFSPQAVLFGGADGSISDDPGNFIYDSTQKALTIARTLSVGYQNDPLVTTFQLWAGSGAGNVVALTAGAGSPAATLSIVFAGIASTQTYTAIDMGQSGAFAMVPAAQLSGGSGFSLECVQISVADITSYSGAVIPLFSAPFTGYITSIQATINGAFGTSDVVITPSVYVGATPTAITGGVVTLAFASSGVGYTVAATPTQDGTTNFAAGSSIMATIAGGDASTVPAVITLYLTRTA